MKTFRLSGYVKATANISHVPLGTIGQIVSIFYEKPRYYYRIVWKDVDKVFTEVYSVEDAQWLFDPIKTR